MDRTIIIICLLFSALFSQYSFSRIPSEPGYPQPGTPAFAPVQGQYLTETSPSDSLLLRRRFSSDEYRFYRGVFTDYARSSRGNIQLFLRPGFISKSSFQQLKWYDSERVNSAGDIAECWYQGDSLYVTGLVRVFYSLDGEWKSLSAVKSAAPSFGDLAVRSNPSGAKISVNGVYSGTATPNYITDIPAGLCRVSIVHPDCIPFDTVVTAEAGKITAVSANLKTRSGAVLFSGYPAGAKIRLYGREIGTVPCRVDQLIPGTYVFTADDPFHVRKNYTVTVRSSGTASVAVQLEKSYGVIHLPVMPGNQFWSVNGEPTVSGDLRFNPGRHRLFWDGKGVYRSVDTVITLTCGDTVPIQAPVQKLFGGIKVLPIPMSCSLYVDGIYRGTAPCMVENLSVGTHRIELVRRGCHRLVKTVLVQSDAVETVRCNLSEYGESVRYDLPGELSFISIPSSAKVYQGDTLIAVTGGGSVKVPAGKYQFRFENGDESRVRTVTVACGERKAVLVSFGDSYE